jgi:1,4-alpha-glucan branching enzyme
MALKAILSLFVLVLSTHLLAEDWVGSYDSEALEEEKAGARVYSLETIERLRRSIAPRYVRVLDFRSRGVLQKGILFTYHALQAKRVDLAGDFSGWKPLPMKRNKNGVFYHILPVREIEGGKRIMTYRYKFQSGGIWLDDPRNPFRTDDGLGGYVSLFELEQEDVNHQVSFRVIRESGRRRDRLVEFAVHERALSSALRRGTVRNVAIVGDFNGWNPDHDWLERGADGIFRLRMRLQPGEYSYQLIVDGNWIRDPYNPETRHHSRVQELVSYAIIP